MALICLPSAVKCLRFPKGSTEDISKKDPLYTFNIQGKVILSLVEAILFWTVRTRFLHESHQERN